ncbi:hypothetical protein Q9233_013583 [Columba guinea]|nr:hypothetical protein Q9233_013583 [Columba guinea]
MQLMTAAMSLSAPLTMKAGIIFSRSGSVLGSPDLGSLRLPRNCRAEQESWGYFFLHPVASLAELEALQSKGGHLV